MIIMIRKLKAKRNQYACIYSEWEFRFLFRLLNRAPLAVCLECCALFLLLFFSVGESNTENSILIVIRSVFFFFSPFHIPQLSIPSNQRYIHWHLSVWINSNHPMKLRYDSCTFPRISELSFLFLFFAPNQHQRARVGSKVIYHKMWCNLYIYFRFSFISFASNSDEF